MLLGATYCSQVAAYTGKSVLGNWIVAKICVLWEPSNVAQVQRIPVNALMVVLFLFQLCVLWGAAYCSQIAAYTSKSDLGNWSVAKIYVLWEPPNVAKVQRIPVNALMVV